MGAKSNNNPHFGSLKGKFAVVEYTFVQHFDEKIYTKENICFKSLKKKPIEIVDLQICIEKTNIMPFRVNNRS